MSRRARRARRALGVGCLCVAIVARPAISQEPNEPSGLAALRAAWIQAYEAGDAAAMADLYVEDAVRMPYDAPAVKGHDSIVAAYGVQFETRRLHPRIDLVPESMLAVGVIAIERGSYDETLTSLDESVQIREIGKYVSVARRGDDGHWRFAIGIFNRDALPEAADREERVIGRVWYGTTTPANADAYERLLREEVLPGIEALGIDGYGGAHLFRREHGGGVEFMTLLWFDSMDAVRAFAGEDYETSVVPPAAAALLETHDGRSAHYDVRMSPR